MKIAKSACFAACIVCGGLLSAFGRDYTGMIPALAGDNYSIAATWDDNGQAPHEDANYYSNGKALQTPSYHNGTIERFNGKALYLDSQLNFADQGPTANFPMIIKNDGLFLDPGADLGMWYGQSYLGGKVTVANDNLDKLVNVHGLGDGVGKTFRFSGELSGGASSGLLVGYNPGFYGREKDGVYRYSGLIVFEFAGTAEEYYGRLATESGAVIRAEASLPHASVVLGLMPANNGRTFPDLFDYSQSLNGVFQAMPQQGSALSVGNLVSNGGTVSVNPGVSLSVGDLELNGGSLVLAGTSGDPATFPSISVSGSYTAASTPVKLFVGGVAPASPKTLIAVPVGNGTLSADDFSIVDLSGVAQALAGATPLRVVIEGGVQKLVYGEGYVSKTANDNDNTHAHVNTDWSDGQQQHAGALYYNAGYNLYFNAPRDNYTFEDGETRRALAWRGKGLVIDGSPLIMTYGWSSDAITVEDVGMVLYGSPHFRTWWEHSAIGGKLDVRTDGVCIESTYKGSAVWDLSATLVGDASAKIRFQHQDGLDTNPNYSGHIYTLNAIGSADGWYGAFFVATNHVLNAQAGFPHGTAEIALGGVLKCSALANPSFGGITLRGALELPAGKVWTVGSFSAENGEIRVSGDTATAGTARVVVSNAVALTGGKLRIALAKRPKNGSALELSAPASCALVASDFVVECEDGFPSERMAVVVSTDGSGRKTYGVERVPMGALIIVM